MFKSDSEFRSFIDFLADLSLDGPNFEVCLAALRLQTVLLSVYGDKTLL